MCAYAVMTTASARKIGRTETNLMFRLSARESVGIFVLLSWSMFYNHVVLGQFLKPSGELPLWFFEIQQPRETAMVGAYHKPAAEQIMSELPGESHHCQQLLSCRTIFKLFLRQRKEQMNGTSLKKDKTLMIRK